MTYTSIKGFGFVSYADKDDADRAKREINHTKIDGRMIEVNDATARNKSKRGPACKYPKLEHRIFARMIFQSVQALFPVKLNNFSHGSLKFVSPHSNFCVHSYATSNDGTAWRLTRSFHEPYDSASMLDSTRPCRPARRKPVHAPHNSGSRLCECHRFLVLIITHCSYQIEFICM